MSQPISQVGIVGLGYVGLPLARVFCSVGHKVIGFDIDPSKISLINDGKNYLHHLGSNFVSEMVDSGRFEATNDFDRLAEPDTILICVPTPLGEHLEPDLSYVEQTTDAIAKVLRSGQLIVLESTTYPGTTRDVVLPRLEATGLRCGSDFFLAYSPEREDPGRQDYTTRTIPKLVGGINDISGRKAADLYRIAFDQVVSVSSAEVAEAAKLLENIYRAVNVALVNEVKKILIPLDIDTWEVIDAAATKPFGFQAFYPGPGLGGHCIPIDPYYLTWKAREIGLSTRFIELAGEINRGMPSYVIERTVWALGQRGKTIRDARVLVLGLAYKPDIDDVRESPSLELIEKLRGLHAQVDYHDPNVPATHRMRNYDLKMKSIELTGEALRSYDCVVVATNHSVYDPRMIADNSALVIDSRGMMREMVSDNIVQA